MLFALTIVVVATAAAGSASAATRTASAKAAGPWGWSASSRSWTVANNVLPAALVAAGPQTPISRSQFVASLAQVEQLRAAKFGSETPLATSTQGAALADVAPTSLEARAVRLGWIVARGGKFDGASPITSNDAALGAASVLGLRNDVSSFAVLLNREVPGTRMSFVYGSAQALVRTAGLRFNVLDPFDAYELGPTEALNVAHGSYMLQAAAGVNDWKLEEAHTLATQFDLPALGPNQNRVLRTAIKQLGQPYIWAGETEGAQPEGHGGFDCSGFALRVINGSGIATADLASIAERTTYTQSAMPRAKRVKLASLQPGDAIYFGSKGPKSTPTENYHAGVYMGNGYFIHSSGGNGGVAINRLDGWWGGQFAWGRRALRHP